MSDLTTCSFCGKGQARVKKLVAGPGVWICNECVDLTAELMKDPGPGTGDEAGSGRHRSRSDVVEVVTSEDAAGTLTLASTFLQARPVHNNLVLSLLHERVRHAEAGRYWSVLVGDEVVGVALQSPLSFHAALTPMPPAVIPVLVDAMVTTAPDLPGVFGQVVTAARLAGLWGEKRGVPVHPVEAQRLYRSGTVVPPGDVPGGVRRAREDDTDLVLHWRKGFQSDTGGHLPAVETVRHLIADGLVSLWEHENPVAMAMHTPAVAGVSRIGFVYTPPEHRRQGFAAACTAAASTAALSEGAEHCVLFTQMANPQSNAIYRRLGYQVVSEQIRYGFTPQEGVVRDRRSRRAPWRRPDGQ